MQPLLYSASKTTLKMIKYAKINLRPTKLKIPNWQLGLMLFCQVDP